MGLCKQQNNKDTYQSYLILYRSLLELRILMEQSSGRDHITTWIDFIWIALREIEGCWFRNPVAPPVLYERCHEKKHILHINW